MVQGLPQHIDHGITGTKDFAEIFDFTIAPKGFVTAIKGSGGSSAIRQEVPTGAPAEGLAGQFIIASPVRLTRRESLFGSDIELLQSSAQAHSFLMKSA